MATHDSDAVTENCTGVSNKGTWYSVKLMRTSRLLNTCGTAGRP